MAAVQVEKLRYSDLQTAVSDLKKVSEEMITKSNEIKENVIKVRANEAFKTPEASDVMENAAIQSLTSIKKCTEIIDDFMTTLNIVIANTKATDVQAGKELMTGQQQ